MKIELKRLLVEASIEEAQRLEEAGVKDVLLAAITSLSFIKPAQAEKLADTLKTKIKNPQVIAAANAIKKADNKEDLYTVIKKYSEDYPLVTKIDRKNLTPPTGYTPVSQTQRKDWNLFLDYLEQKGLSGDPSLDRYVSGTNKTKGIAELENYLQENPRSTLSVDIIRNIQYEMKLLREGESNFPGLSPSQLLVLQELLLRVRPKFMSIRTSDKDGKIGQWTSKEYYPEFSGSVNYSEKIKNIASTLINKYGVERIYNVDLKEMQ